MTRVLVIHGPNLNLLGVREPDVYGRCTLAQLNERIHAKAQELSIEVRTTQSNSEADIIGAIHGALEWGEGIIINPGAFTHYSYAIRDAVAAVRMPVIEVHISNVHGREEFRRHSVIAPVVYGQIVGFSANSYLLALHAMRDLLEESRR